MSDKPIPAMKVLGHNRPKAVGGPMRVIDLEPWARNAAGQLLSGICTFSDGKVWKWHRSHDDGSFYFTIDSGVPSQWSLGNYGRTVAYPKRVAALREKLQEIGEL